MWTLLVLFHLFFFCTLYQRPHLMATSELLSTFFPTWLNRRKHDPYWLNTHGHPVLSHYYWPHALLAAIAPKRSLDRSFNLLVYHLLAHHLFASIGWYLLLLGPHGPLAATFGAITFTYSASHLKQQPSIVYTISWFPWVCYGLSTGNLIFSSIAIGLMLLGGYYPLAIYLIPTATILWFGATSLWSLAIGLLIASPQLIPFFRYLPKTIRGKVKAPSDSPTEHRFYFGLTPIILLLIAPKWAYLALLIPFLAFIWPSSLFRVPSRALLLSCYAAIWFSLDTVASLTNQQILLLTFIQAWDLWLHNRGLLPPRPYCELWQRPSRIFNSPLTRFLDQHLGAGRVAGLPHPLFTGLINNHRTLGYCGSMQNTLMWKWRHSFRHDPFIDGVSQDDLTRYGVRFAWSRKRLDWPSTVIPHLYRNPDYKGC